MSMTREEAICTLERLQHTESKWPGTEDTLEALDLAITALRTPTREMVEKMRGEWEIVPDTGFVDSNGRQVCHLNCPRCNFYWREIGHAKYFDFCPSCGAPMTDEAVQAAEARASEALAKLEKVKNPAAHKVNFLFGELSEDWNRLRAALHELEKSDAEAAGKMRAAITGTVAGWTL